MEGTTLTSTLEELQALGMYTGMGDVYMAMIEKAESAKEPPTYGKPILIAEGVSFGITPEYAEGKKAASDRTVRQRRMPTGYTVKIASPRIKAAIRAYLLGHAVDSKGGELLTDADAPYVAIGYAAHRDSGKSHMRWLYKVKFSEQTIEDKTAEDGTIEYRDTVLEGKAERRNDTVMIGGERHRPLRYDADLENATCTWTEETFFASVPEYTPAA